MQAQWVLWGADLSPYALKVEALLRFAELPFRWLPRCGSFREALQASRRRAALVAGRQPLSWPPRDPLDEYPLVPFLFGPAGENLYDSSAIGAWLACRPTPGGRETPSLLPHDPALRFAVRLVDEALDEVGLYLVHHNRWVVAARDNGAGKRLAREMHPLLGPLAKLVEHFFPARQVRRLPYLFSVADPRDSRFDDLPRRLRPPPRAGFPPTHALLDALYTRLLTALEPLLAQRPFVFGPGFTLADASIYGQLGMNLTDPGARAALHALAPCVERWALGLAGGHFDAHKGEDRLLLDEAVAPLLAWVCDGFVPLMRQNAAAYETRRRQGERLFNEAAFKGGHALYTGTLLGHPFRSVVKTFQVRVWRDLRAEWEALAPADRARLEALLPEHHGLGRS